MTLPAVALVRVAPLKRSGGRLSTSGKVKNIGHVVLWANGQFYDPAYGIMPDVQVGRRITHVVEIKNP